MIKSMTMVLLTIGKHCTSLPDINYSSWILLPHAVRHSQIMNVGLDQCGGVLSPIETVEVLFVHAEQCIHGVTENVDDHRLWEHQIDHT